MLDHSLPPDVHPAASGDSHPPVSPEDAITRVGNRIRQARDTMSVKRLADVSGISAGLISEIERGKGNPSFKTLHAIANALGLRIGDLVDDDDDGPKATTAAPPRSCSAWSRRPASSSHHQPPTGNEEPMDK
jgi:ribosome-binding protein aMBF1 (putative translation factor)